MRGAYILVISLATTAEIQVGRLGRRRFEDGLYLYVGSALGGLAARIGRHLRQAKKQHWHVDYLLAQATVKEVWLNTAPQRRECQTARALAALPGVSLPVSRFGSSDCDCLAHLLAVPAVPAEALIELGYTLSDPGNRISLPASPLAPGPLPAVRTSVSDPNKRAPQDPEYSICRQEELAAAASVLGVAAHQKIKKKGG
jgi:Uri superfamily endonuclease